MCLLTDAPERSFLDRLARWFEGGDVAAGKVDSVVDLRAILAPGIAPAAEVVDFYLRPGDYCIRTGVQMRAWSRIVIAVFGALCRQCQIPARGKEFENFELCQRIYRDSENRTHWDRYVRVDENLHRLFIARLSSSKSTVNETFVMWGIPVRLTFDATVVDDGLVLTMRPLRSSPLAWAARVQYKTNHTAEAGAIRTLGDFRVPLIGLNVQTEFRATRRTGRDCGDDG